MEEGISHNPINEGQNVDVPILNNDQPAHGHGKKTLLSYFREGLMIFVAVVMGFLAENYREGYINREKEQQYISSYIRNLHDDAINLDSTILHNDIKLRYLDSILLMSKTGVASNISRQNFYNYCLHTVSYYAEFDNNDATFLQLAYSGGLRLVIRDRAADRIAEYASKVKDVMSAMGLYEKATEAATAQAQEVLDYTLVYDSSYYRDMKFTGKYIPLVSEDPLKMKLLFNKISFERAATENYLKTLNSLKPYLENFIQYLEKLYPKD
jgi:hypothetical protein